MSTDSAPHRLFCILALQRSGTTWLVDLLDHHPQVRCTYDILTRNPFEYGIPAAKGAPSEVYQGFKILEWQNAWWLPELLRNPLVPVILQWRSNPVRHLYSCLAAQRSGVYHGKPMARQVSDRLRHAWQSIWQGKLGYTIFAARTLIQMTSSIIRRRPLYQPEPLRIAPDELDRFLETSDARLAELRRALEERGGPCFELTYEQLSGSRHQKTLADLQSFLGLQVVELHSTIRKLNDLPLRELLENYDELQQHCNRRQIVFE